MTLTELAHLAGTIWVVPYKDIEKQRAAVRKTQTRKREALYQYKESKPCSDCAVFYPYYVMQFDHVGEKSFTPGVRSASFGSAKFMAEIEKCELVCSNCHTIRTHQRRSLSSDR